MNKKRIILIAALVAVAAMIYYLYRKMKARNYTIQLSNPNVQAFLNMLRWAEGTDGADGYAVCYGYSHTITNFSDHPAITGEWTGKVLTPTQCANAGLGAGCKSTAAGAYQITKTTWRYLRNTLLVDLPDFSPASQDKAAIALIDQRGALGYVESGNIQEAIYRCRNEWASLPGNGYGQGPKSLAGLLNYYQSAGGDIA